MMLEPAEQAALLLSLSASARAVLWSLPLAVGLGWLLGTRRFPGHAALNALVHLPLVLPPVVLGYLLLLALGRRGPIGAPLEQWFGLRIAFSESAVVIACAVVGFPLMVRAIRQSAEALDPRFARAARSLGASEVKIFATVTLPLMAPGILTGLTLAFARAVGEFGATITLAGNIPGRTQTLPLALFTVTQSPGGEAAATRLCLLSLALAGAALLASEAVSRRLTWQQEARA
ncbi:MULTISPECIES: molybdate ABC transporter permease subunit [unclassified Salipiger]|uniref:molybdate ABC transporter permease subunit n=1 Tax=unclassified Salipiger TaxID=2640570 RepID=UPI00080ABE72|nr:MULTISPECIES: molybdate ABC transporter permease subunit [unclassified Salipiger]ANT58933.1 molybdate ABC transporter permease [Salipiger sp. CCB-MM3]NDV99386.1 molybdate ABC transporter permease subunit [Salipiger sp. PrR002]NDW55872.1 molybdate ABC transporter permease subunit [Salipiger sp. PrR004]